MDEKIVLIDGHSIMFRAFYGMPLAMTAPDGTHTNAVYGFLSILRKVLEEEKPEYLVVAFDRSEPTFRHEKYPAYKGTRQAAPPEFHEQMPVILRLLDSMEIPHISIAGWEADDILGTLSRRSEKKGLKVSLVSGDRDLLQIATDRTEIIIPKTKAGQTTYERYFASDVAETVGVTPSEFIDMKALMGDSSDNIPGLPGVGPKTALAIIEKYHSIENAHAHVDEIRPKKAQNAMQDHYDLAVLSKDLATIRLNAPVEADYDAFRLGNIYNEKSYEMFRSLNFRSLFYLFEEKETENAKKDVSIHLLKTEEELNSAGDAALETLGGDENTVGIEVLMEKGVPYAAAFSCGETYAFRIGEEISADAARDALLTVCRAAEEIASCNVKDAARFLGLQDAEKWTDCVIGAYLIDPLRSDWDYGDIATGYLGMTVKTREELIGKKGPAAWLKEAEKKAIRNGKQMTLPIAGMTETEETEKAEDLSQNLALCAGYAAFTARNAKDPILKKLDSENMADLFRSVEMPLTCVLAQMEKEGILASRKALIEYGEMLSVRIRELTEEIYAEAEEEFNLNSPKQLGTILFEKMKLPGGKKTKTGYSTAADVLEKMAPDHKIVADILEYRTYSKLKSTYADGLLTCIEEDGRIRTTFNQTITATGRLSSTDPNLQNIPMREDLGRRIRKCFYPREGCVFVDADYSQIELRVLAHMSGDEKLIEAYREAKDIHAATASQVFHVPYSEVTDQMRRNAKAVNFGIVYGISSFGLSQGLSISRKEAQDYIDQYFLTYPSIKTFLDDLVHSAKEKGYAVSLFGRRRPIPELKSSNFMQRNFGERVAMNSPIQGTAADIIKIAMIRVAKRLAEEKMESKLILQIHDELLIEAPQQEAEKAREILEEEMKAAASLRVELETDCHIGSDWYEAK
ncbi:MAG: DNA polymerase I [Eubacteriales bacterium]